MLDTTIMREQNFPKDLTVFKKVFMQNSKAEQIAVNYVTLPEIIIGNTGLSDIPTQLLCAENPAHFKTHLLGNEVLKRFNTILDFHNNMVYLKPNLYTKLTYADADKNH